MATGVEMSFSGGERRAIEKAEGLIPLVYDELRGLARVYLGSSAPSHTLQPTALVHEAYLKLIHQENASWVGKTHFLAVAARAMRQILVDYARARNRKKRWGGSVRLDFEEAMASPEREENILALDAALIKLAAIDPAKAHIVELRFFAGMSVQEVADLLGCSKRKVEQDWTFIRAWLRRELSSEE